MKKKFMKFLIYLVGVLVSCHISQVCGYRIVCHYDTSSANRVGPLKFSSKDLELGLKFCSHVIYGYVTIRPETFVVTTLTALQEQEFANMNYFKNIYPKVKFLLSISGDDSVKTTQNFVHLLEARHQVQQSFIDSAMHILNKYKFDGLSLDFPLPTETPIKILSKYAKLWNSCKNFFLRSPKPEPRVDHKEQFTDLIQQLSRNLKKENLMLTLTVLPNTNSKLYFDIPVIAEYLDFVILSAFDFNTPDRNPHEADFMAPIKPLEPKGHRLQQTNVKYLVQHWHHQQLRRNKIVIGIATWGRSWKMSTDSTNSGIPPVFYTKGPATAGPLTHKPGFLSWPEICQLLKPSKYESKKKEIAPLQRVIDPNKKNGNYAFRPADRKGKNGIWISYEEPSTAAGKAKYVRNHNLGGIALFDLSLDDFGGYCTGDKFPFLRTIKAYFQKEISGW